jgi:NTP pyrophosphatase (non-canonical NTP hydrolase)
MNSIALNVLDQFKNKLGERLTDKGRKTWHSPHEALGKVTEEYFELIEAIHLNNKGETIEELFDVMIASFWGIVSIITRTEDDKITKT